MTYWFSYEYKISFYSDADWWRACHLSQMTEGFVPRNYVAPEKTIESEE